MNATWHIYLDANVLFSVGNPTSNIYRLLTLARDAGHTLVSCELAIREAKVNIERKRPDWRIHFDAWLGRIQIVPALCFALEVELAEKDIPVLCAAIRARCDLFVTGDKQHFGHLFDQEVLTTRIISLLRLAELLVDTNADSQ